MSDILEDIAERFQNLKRLHGIKKALESGEFDSLQYRNELLADVIKTLSGRDPALKACKDHIRSLEINLQDLSRECSLLKDTLAELSDRPKPRYTRVWAMGRYRLYLDSWA